MIYIDLSELIIHSRHSDVVSGIQRVVYHLARSLESDAEVGYVVLTQGSWIRLNALKLESTCSLTPFKLLDDNWRLYRFKWSQTRRRIQEVRRCRKVKPLVKFLLSRLVRPLRSLRQHDLEGLHASLMPPEAFKEGDVLVEPAIPQTCDIFRMHIEPFVDRIKLVFFFHDIIPLTGKQFVLEGENKNFQKYFDLMMERGDLLLTSATYNVEDFRKYAAVSAPGKTIPPIVPIGLPVEFSTRVTQENFYEVSPIGRRLSAYKFCLCVGSVGPRKNHFELLQAWKKFYESDAYDNEILVVAGAPWESAPDIVDLLRNRAFCGGSIVYLERPSDIELAHLYEHCRFTLCLSLFEGWGLPVSESIAMGKPAVILNETTLPEAGYGVANVVETRRLRDLQKMIERMFGDEEFHEASLKRVLEAGKNMPTWNDFAQRLVSSVRAHLTASKPDR